MNRGLRWLGLLWVVLAILMTGVGTTTVSASPFTYDAHAIARSDTRAVDRAETSPAQLKGAPKGSAAPYTAARGTSTTQLAQSVATEAGEGTYDWRKLGNREFENFFGESAEDVKKDIVGSGGSKFDLYEDKCTGEIFVLRKGGVGEPQPTGYRFPK